MTARTQPMTATPTPWVADPDWREGYSWNIHIVDAANPDMRICFMTSDGPAQANADLIVEAVNNYASLKARIEELESNERAYEKILGKRTYREVADRMKEMEEALQIARTFISDEPIEHAIVNVHSMQSLVQLLDAALEAKHD